MSSVYYTSILRPMDDHTIAALRLILAVVALLIMSIDPSALSSYVVATYTSLALYVVYSTALFVFTLRGNSHVLVTIAHWIDVGWYTILIGVSGSTNSIYFPLCFFAILVASFRWGFETGLRVTVVSVVLFSSVGFVIAPAEPGFELNRFLLRHSMLLVLGYMMACWGGFEITLKRRLALLKDISTFSNPRFGVDRTLGSLMEHLRAFYDADACLLVMANPRTGGHDLRRVDRRDSGAAVCVEPIAEGLARLLLDLPATQAAVSCHVPRLWAWWCRDADVRTYDVETGEVASASLQMRGVLEAESFITVPLRLYRETVGRLYLTASRRRIFDTADVRFLLQALEHVMPTLENIRLVNQLASTAAEMERQRIARDLHDSVIQPYIGLKTGLSAIDQKLTAGRIDVRGDIRQLLELIDIEVADLRRYTARLNANGEREDSLLLLARRFAERFAKATGIAVHVEAKTPLDVNDRLVAEMFQIIVEGLSNVRRHTRSMQAIIRLMICNGHLILRIANDVAAGERSPSFIPRSITERTAALGGCTRIEQSEGNGTVVVVDIPL